MSNYSHVIFLKQVLDAVLMNQGIHTCDIPGTGPGMGMGSFLFLPIFHFHSLKSNYLAIIIILISSLVKIHITRIKGTIIW